MSENCNHQCGSCGETCSERTDFREQPNKGSRVKKIIGVVSGKGGVGKTLVTSTLAVMMNRKGYRTGVLDADITGPSIPKMFGIHEKAASDGVSIYPEVSKNGIKVMSTNLLLPNETDPVIWRGPVIAGVVKQFWTDVAWGDIDYLFVDMPPGTGDVPLTVFQSFPVDGIIIVTTPQDLVSMIVEKAVNMAEKMNIPVLGLVENMAYFICDECKKKHYIFGESHMAENAEKHGIPYMAQIPMDPSIIKFADTERIEELSGECYQELEDMLDLVIKKFGEDHSFDGDEEGHTCGH